MPIRSSKEAPRFDGVATNLDRYLDDVELVCLNRDRSAEIVKWAVYYTDEKSSGLWKTTRDSLADNTSWEAFKTAITKLYPEAKPENRHTIAALQSISSTFQAKQTMTGPALGEFHREFSETAGFLVSKSKMTRREAGLMFISSFPTEYRPDITTRLTVKHPDVRPDEGYELADIFNAAEFVISSRPVIALMAATMPPKSAPISATPPPRSDGQRYERPWYDCTFCWANGHSLRYCPTLEDYIRSNKCQRNSERRIQLPDGSELIGPGKNMKEKIDRWHQIASAGSPASGTNRTPLGTPTIPTSASTNLLEVFSTEASDAAEIYNARQTTAMPKSKQPVPPPPVASSSSSASGSKGKEKDTPAFKYRTPIDDTAAPKRIIDHLLSLPVSITAKDILALSPSVQKELRQLVTSKRVDTASANEVEVIPDEPAPEIHDEVEVLMASTRPIESLRAVDGIFDGNVKCECVIDNGSQIIVIRKDKWQLSGAGYAPTRKIMMETANSSSSWTMGITTLSMTVGGITIRVQAHIVEDAPYEVLLGRPFHTLLSAITRDYPDGGQDITITCPETRATAVLLTRPRTNKNHTGVRPAGLGF